MERDGVAAIEKKNSVVESELSGHYHRLILDDNQFQGMNKKMGTLQLYR